MPKRNAALMAATAQYAALRGGVDVLQERIRRMVEDADDLHARLAALLEHPPFAAEAKAEPVSE